MPNDTPKWFKDFFIRIWANVWRIVNGGIAFGIPPNTDNIDGSWGSFISPGVADTEFTVTHNLGRVPSGWLLVNIDKAAILYKGATPWTAKQMSLKCNQASATATIFVI